MLKKIITISCVATAIFTNAFANSNCPSVDTIRQGKLVGYFPPGIFMYMENNNYVFVSIPPTDANPHPTEADAKALLNTTTTPYPNDSPERCFYAPYATYATTEKSFVMWSDQRP